MNLEFLSRKVADTNGGDYSVTKDSLRLALKFLVESIKNGDNVKLKGFGTFSLVKTPPRKYKTPNGTVSAPARMRVKFKASEVFKNV